MANQAVFTVILVRIPGSSTTVNLTEPVTIAQAVTAGGDNPGDWKYQINGQEVPAETQVTEHTGTIRMFINKVKGN